MPFYQNPNKTPTPAEISVFDESCAKLLWAALVQANIPLSRKSQIKRWAECFAKLRGCNDHYTPHMIDTILGWYCKNVRKPYVPQAWSGKAFCAKIAAIEGAMNRDIEKNGPQTISDAAKEVVKRVKKWQGIDRLGDLPKSAQRALDIVVPIRRSLRALRSSEKTGSNLWMVADHLICRESELTNFIVKYLDDLCENFAVPKKVPVYPTVNSRFQTWVANHYRTRVLEYTDDAKLWEALSRRIGCSLNDGTGPENGKS